MSPHDSPEARHMIRPGTFLILFEDGCLIDGSRDWKQLVPQRIERCGHQKSWLSRSGCCWKACEFGTNGGLLSQKLAQAAAPLTVGEIQSGVDYPSFRISSDTLFHFLDTFFNAPTTVMCVNERFFRTLNLCLVNEWLAKMHCARKTPAHQLMALQIRCEDFSSRCQLLEVHETSSFPLPKKLSSAIPEIR
jgi:hypothetical protein